MHRNHGRILAEALAGCQRAKADAAARCGGRATRGGDEQKRVLELMGKLDWDGNFDYKAGPKANKLIVERFAACRCSGRIATIMSPQPGCAMRADAAAYKSTPSTRRLRGFASGTI